MGFWIQFLINIAYLRDSFRDYSDSSKLLVCRLISWSSYMKCHSLFCYWACIFIGYILNPGKLPQTDTTQYVCLRDFFLLLFKSDLHPLSGQDHWIKQLALLGQVLNGLCVHRAAWSFVAAELQCTAPTFPAVLPLIQSRLTGNDFCSLSTWRGTAVLWMTSAACQAVPAGSRDESDIAGEQSCSQWYWLYATAGCKIPPSSAMPWEGQRGSLSKAIRIIFNR